MMGDEAGAPDVAVVICAYTEDRWDDILAAVSSVQAQRPVPAEVIVVVDHNPLLRARLEAAHLNVTIVENDGQRGLSDARNRGVRAASAPIVAFLDDDASAAPGWIAALRTPYARNAVVGVGGSARPVWRGGGRPSWFPPEFDWVIGCSYRGLPTKPAPIRNFLGCNMSFRREAFAYAGGFHTSVGRVGTKPVGGEETEFCIRVARTIPGAELLYVPAAAVLHAVPPSRATLRYFLRRCFAEGQSKAIVSALAGREAGLDSERRHAAVTLPLGAVRHLLHGVVRRDPAGISRAAVIVVGLMTTIAGYGVGTVGALLPGRRMARS